MKQFAQSLESELELRKLALSSYREIVTAKDSSKAEVDAVVN